MNRWGLGFLSLAMGGLLPQALRAQSTSLNGAVALGSQLVDRGTPMTPTTPILQGAVSWTPTPSWSLGVSGAIELRSPGRLAEALVQASRNWSLSSDWQMQASLLYYRYSGMHHAGALDRAEAGVSWTYRDVLAFSLSAIRVFGAQGDQPRGAADISLHWPLARHVWLSAGAGVSQSLIATREDYRGGHDADSYYSLRPGLHGYGHAGLLWSNGPWKVELDRILAAPETRQQWTGRNVSPWVATISRSF